MPEVFDVSSDISTVSIRRAEKKDIEAIRDIYNYYVSRSTATFALTEDSEEERNSWFQQHQDKQLPVIVAENGGRVVGWASLSYYHSRCGYKQTVEPSLYVLHEYCNRGLGRRLTKELLKAAKERGYHCIVSLVCSENKTSLSLLKKFGFEERGELKEAGRKFDRWLNVTIMQLML